MIRDTLISALDTIDNHKFGTKQKKAQEEAKQNAQKYMSIIKTLPKDYYKIMYLLWMAEFKMNECKKNDKEMYKKFQTSAKNIRAYIQEQIDTVVFP